MLVIAVHWSRCPNPISDLLHEHILFSYGSLSHLKVCLQSLFWEQAGVFQFMLCLSFTSQNVNGRCWFILGHKKESLLEKNPATQAGDSILCAHGHFFVRLFLLFVVVFVFFFELTDALLSEKFCHFQAWNFIMLGVRPPGLWWCQFLTAKRPNARPFCSFELHP